MGTKHCGEPPGADWIKTWLKKQMAVRGLGPAEVGRRVGKSSQRISQITVGEDRPSLHLLWRLAAAFQDDEAAFQDDEEREQTTAAEVRRILESLVVSLGPERLAYLLSLPEPERRDLIDRHAVRRRSNLGPPAGSKKK